MPLVKSAIVASLARIPAALSSIAGWVRDEESEAGFGDCLFCLLVPRLQHTGILDARRFRLYFLIQIHFSCDVHLVNWITVGAKGWIWPNHWDLSGVNVQTERRFVGASCLQVGTWTIDGLKSCRWWSERNRFLCKARESVEGCRLTVTWFLFRFKSGLNEGTGCLLLFVCFPPNVSFLGHCEWEVFAGFYLKMCIRLNKMSCGPPLESCLRLLLCTVNINDLLLVL